MFETRFSYFLQYLFQRFAIDRWNAKTVKGMKSFARTMCMTAAYLMHGRPYCFHFACIYRPRRSDAVSGLIILLSTQNTAVSQSNYTPTCGKRQVPKGEGGGQRWAGGRVMRLLLEQTRGKPVLSVTPYSFHLDAEDCNSLVKLTWNICKWINYVEIWNVDPKKEIYNVE